MASSKQKYIKGYIPEAEVQQIVRSAVRQAAREASKQHATTPAREDLKETVKTAMREVFLSIGLDISDPIKAQRNMAYLNNLAEFSRKTKLKIVMTAIGLATTAAVAAVLIGLGVPAKLLVIFGLAQQATSTTP